MISLHYKRRDGGGSEKLNPQPSGFLQEAYDLFAKWVGLKWDKPIYRRVRKIPFILLEREIDDLIAGCPKHIATFL